LDGELRTASGWGRLRVIEAVVAEDGLRQVIAAAEGDAGVRVNVAEPPIVLLQRAGARFLGIDADLLADLPEDDLGDALDAGMGLMVGAFPLDPAADPDLRP